MWLHPKHVPRTTRGSHARDTPYTRPRSRADRARLRRPRPARVLHLPALDGGRLSRGRQAAGTCGTQSGWPSRRLVAIKARSARPSARACPGGARGSRASCGFSGRRGALRDGRGVRPRTSAHFCHREATWQPHGPRGPSRTEGGHRPSRHRDPRRRDDVRRRGRQRLRGGERRRHERRQDATSPDLEAVSRA